MSDFPPLPRAFRWYAAIAVPLLATAGRWGGALVFAGVVVPAALLRVAGPLSARLRNPGFYLSVCGAGFVAVCYSFAFAVLAYGATSLAGLEWANRYVDAVIDSVPLCMRLALCGLPAAVVAAYGWTGALAVTGLYAGNWGRLGGLVQALLLAPAVAALLLRLEAAALFERRTPEPAALAVPEGTMPLRPAEMPVEPRRLDPAKTLRLLADRGYLDKFAAVAACFAALDMAGGLIYAAPTEFNMDFLAACLPPLLSAAAAFAGSKVSEAVLRARG